MNDAYREMVGELPLELIDENEFRKWQERDAEQDRIDREMQDGEEAK